MKKAFENILIIDTTHVLAGPFASYQLAVLGAEVIKVESPLDPDQARMQGSDRSLNDQGLGTAFLSQGSNKKCIALDLKKKQGQEILKELIKEADVFVENYRPGAMTALGLGYEDLAALNPSLIYCSISAFGTTGPRQNETAYDNVIQAFSGMMAMTGIKDSGPLKSGAPVVDYATGAMAAFSIASALYQREAHQSGGQHIDVSMLDVAMMLSSSHLTGYLWNGKHPEPKGNRFPFATIGYYETTDSPIMIAASNLKQQKRLWTALGREDLIKENNNQRLDGYEEEAQTLRSIIGTMPAAYWEAFLQSRRVPVSRIRRMEEALADPQLESRSVIQSQVWPQQNDASLRVPVSAFTMSKSPGEVTLPPQMTGAQTHEILEALGYDSASIERLVAEGVINESTS